MSFEVGLAIILTLFPFGWEMMGFPHVRIVGVLSWAACLGILAHLTLKSVWFQRKFERYPRSVSATLGSLATLALVGLVTVGWWLWTGSPSPNERTITISAYQPVYPNPMLVIKDQAFEDQDVPLDGYLYDHCTFTNVCFRYEGQAYQLQNATLKKGGQVCVQDQRLKNLMELQQALRLMVSNASLSQGVRVPPR